MTNSVPIKQITGFVGDISPAENDTTVIYDCGPTEPLLYDEYVNTKVAFHTLRFFGGGRGIRPDRQIEVALWEVTQENADTLRLWINQYWRQRQCSEDPPPSKLREKRKQCREERRKAMQTVSRAAEACGYHMHGYSIRRCRTASSVAGTSTGGSTTVEVNATARPSRRQLLRLVNAIDAALVKNEAVSSFGLDWLYVILQKARDIQGEEDYLRTISVVRSAARSVLSTMQVARKLEHARERVRQQLADNGQEGACR